MAEIKKKVYSDTDKDKLRAELYKIGNEEVAKNIFFSIKSRYKILYIVSSEEERVVSYFKKFCASEIYSGYVWDCSRGLINIHSEDAVTTAKEEITDPEAILSHAIDLTQQGKEDNGRIYLLLDFHKFLEDADAVIERKMKEFAHYSEHDTIVIVAPEYVCGTTLDKEVTMIDFPYPSKHEIGKKLDDIRQRIVINLPETAKMAKDKKEDLINAVSGLTLNEAKNAFAKTIVKDRTFKIPTLLREKELIIKKGGLLEICDTDISMDDVGGLEVLKDWLYIRKSAFSDDAREFGLPLPRGIMLSGSPGCVLADTKIKIKKVSNEGKHAILIE